MKFWPFPLIRVYSTSKAISHLFERFADDEQFEVVEFGEYRTKVKASFGEMQFWSANKWYAYGNNGIATVNGHSFSWSGQLPSRWAVRRFRVGVEQAQALKVEEMMEVVKA